MGEFERVCQRIADIISERQRAGGVNVDDLPKITAEAIGRETDEINCYPGVPGTGCHDLALFFSLRVPIAKGGKHLNFLQALHKIVQHMQGSCSGTTRHAVFFTDSWDAIAYEEWKANIHQIQRNARVEAYLMVGGRVTLVQI